jgi:hypothetical protein
MPVTLAQAQVNTQSDIDYAVYDNFRRNSWFWDHLVFDDTVTPGSTGASLTYSYVRKLTGASAAPRAINSEYIPSKATRQQVATSLIPLGGSYELDRVIAQLGPAATNEIVFQSMELQIAARIRLVRESLYGDTSADATTFNGLSKILTGGLTESTTLDISSATINTQALANTALDKIDLWLSNVIPSNVGGMTPGDPNGLPVGVRAICGNTRSILRLRNLFRWATLLQSGVDNFDQPVMSYNGWTLVDLGNNADNASPIIPTTANVTEFYAICFGMDSFHMASAAGVPLMRDLPPRFDLPGAVKLGELEVGPIAPVLKSVQACGVYRSVTV